MDLEVIRWKTEDELEPEEAIFLRENKDKLNDEELAAFSNALKDPEVEAIEDVSEKDNSDAQKADDNTESGDSDTEKKEEGEKKELQYLTKEEGEAFVKKALEDRDAAKKDSETGTKEEQIAKKEILKLFDDGYKAKDANEFANTLIEKVMPILTQKTIESIGQMNADQRKKFDDENSRLDTEYADLAKKNGWPALDTEEGQKINAELATVAAKYGMTDYYKAAELWQQLPTKFGGGLTIEAEADNKKKEALKGQKKAASMVGGGGGDAGTKDKGAGPSREDIATNDMDTLLERAQA